MCFTILLFVLSFGITQINREWVEAEISRALPARIGKAHKLFFCFLACIAPVPVCVQTLSIRGFSMRS